MLFNFPLQTVDVKPSPLSTIIQFCKSYKTYLFLGIIGVGLLLMGHIHAAIVLTMVGGLSFLIYDVLLEMPNLDFTSVNVDFDLQDVIDDLEQGFA